MLFRSELKAQGLTTSTTAFLDGHRAFIDAHLTDEWLASR